MPVRIKLLGSPQITVDGAVRRLRGRKSWGLLTALLLESGPTRRELADRLFADAADPLATLRWHLLQVRRAIQPAEVVESAGRLRIEGAMPADVVQVLNGAVALEAVPEVCRGELLEGITFAGTPGFDLWLSLQRNRVAASVGDTLRWAANLRAKTNPSEALILIERALLSDPFNDALHELAVDIHAEQSNVEAAEDYLERVGTLYRTELNVELPESIRRPLHRAAQGSVMPQLDSDINAKALMKVVEARLEANDYQRAMHAARRAAARASESDDSLLQARALLTLARTLIHALPNRDQDAVGLLGRALGLAQEEEDPSLLAEIECEMGFVWMIQGRYGPSEAALTRSVRWAQIDGDRALQAKALTFRAISSSDRTDHQSAERDFDDALALLSAEADRAPRGYTRGGLARVLMRTGRLGEARSAATVALEEIQSGGWHGTAPWALAQLGESALLQGDTDHALEHFQHGFALATEYPDACWQSISLRGLGLCAAWAGHGEEARRLLTGALQRAQSTGDVWSWAVAAILVDLAEVEGGSVAGHVDEAWRLVSRAPMPDLAQRLQRFL